LVGVLLGRGIAVLVGAGLGGGGITGRSRSVRASESLSTTAPVVAAAPNPSAALRTERRFDPLTIARTSRSNRLPSICDSLNERLANSDVCVACDVN
jgi:hypothetical protein